MTIRLFAGIPLTPEWKSLIQEWIKSVGSQIGLRWTPIENLHITLNFFSQVEIQNLSRLHEALYESTKRLIPFDLKVESVNCKMNRGKPSMIWLQMHHSNEFVHVSSSIAKATEGVISYKQDFKNPTPHVTLARMNGKYKGSVYQMPELSLHGVITVDHIILYKSELQSDHARYLPLKVYNLNG